MFENIMNFFKKFNKKDENTTANSKDAAKERLHLVLMQDRANVSADFLELMKQEIIEVIKKYIDVDESAIDVRLTNKENSDGTNGAPALYANIPILNIKNEARKVDIKEKNENNKENMKSKKDEENKENVNKNVKEIDIAKNDSKQKQDNVEKDDKDNNIELNKKESNKNKKTKSGKEKDSTVKDEDKNETVENDKESDNGHKDSKKIEDDAKDEIKSEK